MKKSDLKISEQSLQREIRALREALKNTSTFRDQLICERDALRAENASLRAPSAKSQSAKPKGKSK